MGDFTEKEITCTKAETCNKQKCILKFGVIKDGCKLYEPIKFGSDTLNNEKLDWKLSNNDREWW